MDKIKNDYDNTVQLLLPYVPEQKGQVFFKVVSPIEENEQGKEAKRIYGGDTSSDIVFSRGVIYDTEYNNHQVLYEHSHRMENGHLYRTILGRKISQLSNEELQYLQDNIKENIKNNRMILAVITEGYDEEIGEEENTYFSVTFDKPYDEEQKSMADRHECETINPDKGEYIFMDYDDAVGFAFDNISVLNQRGNFRRELSEDNQISFVVTFETDNPKLKEIAARNHGDADYTKLGNPLVIAIFSKLRDARNYRDEARRILSGGETKKIRLESRFGPIYRKERFDLLNIMPGRQSETALSYHLPDFSLLIRLMILINIGPCFQKTRQPRNCLSFFLTVLLWR